MSESSRHAGALPHEPRETAPAALEHSVHGHRIIGHTRSQRKEHEVQRLINSPPFVWSTVW